MPSPVKIQEVAERRRDLAKWLRRHRRISGYTPAEIVQSTDLYLGLRANTHCYEDLLAIPDAAKRLPGKPAKWRSA